MWTQLIFPVSSRYSRSLPSTTRGWFPSSGMTKSRTRALNEDVEQAMEPCRGDVTQVSLGFHDSMSIDSRIASMKNFVAQLGYESGAYRPQIGCEPLVAPRRERLGVAKSWQLIT